MKNVKPRSKINLRFLALFYLPGTIIHEASHYLFAKLLFVPVGSFSIIPRFEENGFVLGSVQIGRTDFVRRFFVGVAPFIVGTLLLVLTSYSFFFFKHTPVEYALLGYLLLCVLNTMWLSKNDLRGTWKFLLILLIALGIFFVLH